MSCLADRYHALLNALIKDPFRSILWISSTTGFHTGFFYSFFKVSVALVVAKNAMMMFK